MENFEFYTPTKIYFGRDTHKKVGEIIAGYGFHKILLHYGGGSIHRSGLYNAIVTSLREHDIAWVELGGVSPNPKLSLAKQGMELCRAENVEFILAAGGGSVLDSAKCIADGAANPDVETWEFFEKKREPQDALPVGAILTLAASGSEMSASCVITNEEGWLKRDCASDLSRPVFSVLNPELTVTLPDYQTACGCVDIMMHTMERYFNSEPENLDLTDGISEALMRTVMDNARILVREPGNLKARAEIMWAGSLSHNGLTGCGTDGGDWATHLLEHEMGGMFDVAHGAGLAAIWGSWARYVWRERPDRFVKFARNVMGVTGQGSDAEIVEQGIQAVEQFYRDLHMPTSMSELGIAPTQAQIEEMASKSVAEGTVKVLKYEDRVAIFQAAL